MCRAFEEMRNESREQERILNIKSLMETLKITSNQAIEALRITLISNLDMLENCDVHFI